jgi:hypothetical protein
MLVLSLLDQCTQRNLGLQRELSKATSKHSTRYTSIPYIFLSHLFHQSHTHITQYLCCLCSFIFQLKILPLLLLDPFGATSCSWNFVTSVDLPGACLRGCFVPENCMCMRKNVLRLKTASTFWSVISLSARLLLFPSCECRTLPKLDRQQKAVVSSYPFKPVTVFDFPCSCSIV